MCRAMRLGIELVGERPERVLRPQPVVVGDPPAPRAATAGRRAPGRAAGRSGRRPRRTSARATPRPTRSARSPGRRPTAPTSACPCRRATRRPRVRGPATTAASCAGSATIAATTVGRAANQVESTTSMAGTIDPSQHSVPLGWAASIARPPGSRSPVSGAPVTVTGHRQHWLASLARLVCREGTPDSARTACREQDHHAHPDQHRRLRLRQRRRATRPRRAAPPRGHGLARRHRPAVRRRGHGGRPGPDRGRHRPPATASR